MFYLALGYFVAYLPYAILAKGLSSGMVPGVHTPVGGLVLLPAAALTAELCRSVDVIYCMTAEHCAAVLALAPDMADRTHCLADTDILEPSATSLNDHRQTAVVIQQAVRQRLAEQFPGAFP